MTADGYALLAQGRNAEGLALSAAMLADSPECPDARVLRGAALKGLGQFAPAIAAFEGVLGRAPGRADVLVNLGNAHAELGHLEAARWCLERALILHPELKAAHDRYVTAFGDFCSPDGAWRKYRMVFLDAFDAMVARRIAEAEQVAR